MQISGQDVDSLIFADADIYFHYSRMRILRIMLISGQDVDSLIFVDADIYFQYLQMRMLKMMWISGPPLVPSTQIHGPSYEVK